MAFVVDATAGNSGGMNRIGMDGWMDGWMGTAGGVWDSG